MLKKILKEIGKNKVLAGMIIAFFFIGMSSLAYESGIFNSWQNMASDTLFPKENLTSEDIVIVAIDAKSLDEIAGLGRFYDWSREYYAKVLNNLSQYNPKAVGIDILFVNNSRGISGYSLQNLLKGDLNTKQFTDEIAKYLQTAAHPEDQAFADAISSYPKTVLASIGVLDGSKIDSLYNVSRVINPIFNIPENSGLTNVMPDNDGMVRRAPLNFINSETAEIFDSFDVKILKNLGVANERLASIPLENGEMLINYFGGQRNYKYVSFVDVYNGTANPSDFMDKVVLIGVADESLKDTAFTPTAKITPMPGVEVHANILQTVLEDKFLVNQSFESKMLTVFILSLVSTFAFMYLPMYLVILYLFLFYTGYYVAAKSFFRNGVLLQIVVPFLLVLFLFIAVYLYRFFTEKKRAKELKNAFSHYVSKDQVDEIIKNPEILKLGGKKLVISVFFSDIVNFTSMSEKMEPQALVSQLNEYFSVMTNVIFKNKGTLDKFEGDAIMAFYNAPLPDAYHAVHACNTSLECRVALMKLNEYWKGQGKPLLDFRVGINTGEAVVGNVGSKERFDYTIMGDTVNLASRLEGANKQYGTRIIVSENTFNVARDYFVFRQIGPIEVKGKEKPVIVYELVGKKN